MASLFMIVDANARLDFSFLTKHRVPAAIPIFGKYRIIDIALSNATFSNITNVAIFTYSNYRSLQDHIGSGSRYDLDRRKDGVFILPPKTYSPVDEEFLSFQRMKEQDEYFNRTGQEYVIITPATIVWAADLNVILANHISSGKDITQVVTSNGERLFTFILSKEKLVNYINSYDEISYRNIVEVFDHSPLESKNTYVYPRFAKYLRSYHDYYESTIRLAQGELNQNLYSDTPKLRTKDPLNPPCYYGPHSKQENSYVSSGANIYGTIINSVISRRVFVGKKAVIKNSIVMNNAVIEDDAYVENAILDKETIVKSGAIVKGTYKEPFISEKKQIVVSSVLPKVAILSAECSPFVKRGGLADMVGSLAQELSKLGADVKVFLPLYKEIKEKFSNMLQKENELTITIEEKEYHINVYSHEEDKLTYYFIDLYMFFDRNSIYGYKDDAYRFAYYSLACLEFVKQNKIPIDIFHLNDWHTALVPIMKKKFPSLSSSKTILTIHNLNYQGETPKAIIEHFMLDYYVSGNTLNILEAGINSADIVTTVSKTYSEELKYAYYSGNLQEAILRRTSSMYGIVNGLDDKFNPKDDLELKAPYSVLDVFDKKEINKMYLSDICGFTYSKDMFIMGMVSRINEAKGFDLIIDSLEEILENDKIYFVLLGVGDERIMNRLKELEALHKGRVKLFLDYYGTKPSYIYSGADVFLMPSKIEPCGTSQMIALKYGTIPIVRQTGGLNDTIESFEPITCSGNGFKFFNYDARDLINTINVAYDTYKNNKLAWKKLIKNAMNSDYSFEKCAKQYINLYNSAREINNE